MKLSDWCKKEGICYKTGWNWFKSGKLPVKSYQTKTGTIIVEPEIEEESVNKYKDYQQAYIYCRVSSHDKKKDLERQVERCSSYANSKGFIIKKIHKEIASGMNDNRPKLNAILKDNPKYIIVEHKDRLTRFGFNYIKMLCEKLGTEIIVINEADNDKEDLISDLISIITSFCGRIYGRRKSKKATDAIKNNLKTIDP